MSVPPEWLLAGRVGRPHGLDGSFHVTRPTAQLLAAAASRRRGRSRARHHPPRRAPSSARSSASRDHDDREAAEALRGKDLLIPRAAAPELGPDEWWAEDLAGCAVHDGDREVGTVKRLMELPSCEVLEVERSGGRRPARAAGRRRGARGRPRAARRSTSTSSSSAKRKPRRSRGDRRVHAVPGRVRLVRAPAARRQRARRRPPSRVRQLSGPHAAERRAGRRHPVRRRRGHGPAGRRRRGGAARALRPRPGRAAPRAARDRAGARRDGCSTTRWSPSSRARSR